MPPSMGFRTFGDPGEAREVDRDDQTALPLATAPGRLSIRSSLIVLLFASAMLLSALGGDLRVLTLHEVFASQTAREMLQRGDWIIPHFAGVPRLNKPAGMYWLIAGCMAIFNSQAEWVARLPAALSGVLLAVTIARLAARWLGDFGGLVAGLMQASIGYVLLQARLAEADMPMAAAVTIAMSAFAVAVVEPRTPPLPRRQFLLLAFTFGLAAGLSVLLKGVGIAFIGAGCLLWVILTRRWSALKFIAHPASVIALVVSAGAWPLAAALANPRILPIWWRELGGRAGGAFDDPDPWYIYFWSVPLLLLPWLPFAIRAIIEWWLRHRNDNQPLRHAHPKALFLACWFAAGMTLLIVIKARHKHYAIPMLPPITLLASLGFISWLKDVASARPKKAGIAVIACLVIGATAAVLAFKFMTKAEVPSAITIGAVAIGLAATLGFYFSAFRRATTAACFATALAGGLGFQALILPAFDDYKVSTALARRATAATPPTEPIYLAAMGETQMAYYIDRPMVRIDRLERRPETPDTPSPLERTLAKASQPVMYILCPQSKMAIFARYGSVTELDRVDHLRRTEKDPIVFIRFTPTPR